MKLRRSFAQSSLLMAALVAACGGASTTDVLGEPEATAFGTQPSEEPTTTSTSLPSSPSPGPADEEPSQPTSPDAGPPDTPPTEPDDPTPPAPSPTIRCGASSCNAGSEVCCASITSSGTKFTCQAASSGSCGYALKITCDDRSDCAPNEVCCATRNVNGVSVSCRTKCEGPAVARLCDPNAAVDECAAIGKTCQSSENIPGASICR